jgi:hypothetical protein
LTFRLPLLIIGIVGFVAFIVTGLSGLIPWVASGPFAAAFLSLIIITQVVEYFQNGESKPQEPKTQPKMVYTNQEPIERDTPDTQNIEDSVSAQEPGLKGAVTIQPESFKKYKASLAKGERLIVEAGADDWIRVEVVSLTESAKLEAGKRYDWERGKEGKNLTVEYEAKRNGNWYIYIFNLARTPLEVGVTLTLE